MLRTDTHACTERDFKKKNRKEKKKYTLPIKCSVAGQPEETAFSKSGCSWSSASADI